MKTPSTVRDLRGKIVTGFTLGALLVGGTLAVPGAAAASSTQQSGPSATVAQGCGFIGWSKYNHCDNGTGVTVMLTVEPIFGPNVLQCVGPGITNLQGGIRWRVIDAWWNGGIHCRPGLYGPA